MFLLSVLTEIHALGHPDEDVRLGQEVKKGWPFETGRVCWRASVKPEERGGPDWHLCRLLGCICLLDAGGVGSLFLPADASGNEGEG